MSQSADNTVTVVLIHGLGRTPASMRILAMRVKWAGFRTATVRYASRRLRLSEAVATSIRQIERTAARNGGRVHIVGHSLGGIIALRVKRARPELVHRVVQLGSPNRGSGLAEKLQDARWARSFFGPVLPELAEDLSDDWRRDKDIAAFAGIEIPPALARRYGVLGPNDGMVNARSAWGREAGVRVPASTFHGWMPLSGSIAAKTIEFLKTGHVDG